MEYRYINEPPKGFCVPHTWGMGGELNAKIIQALIEELSLWEKLGYSFKFGIEQEYQNKPIHVMQAGVNGALSQGSVIAHDVVEQKRQLLLVGVENESTRNLILQFKPEELARFELERRCLGATNTVFGRYYDERYPDSVMEIPFTAASPLLAINNFHMVLSTMSNVNSSMGIQPPNMYKTDISFSVWQHGNNNISDIQNRDPRALAIMDGLLRYVYDAAPIFMRKYRVDKYLSYQNVDTGPIRAASVRQADGRFEIRLDNNPTAGEHIASTILAVMRSVRFGFMLHGIESEAIGSIPQGHPSLDPNSPYFTTKSRFGVKKMFEPIDKDNDSSFYTLEILNGSKMGAEGVFNSKSKAPIYIRY